jgi:hypothetical protein
MIYSRRLRSFWLSVQILFPFVAILGVLVYVLSRDFMQRAFKEAPVSLWVYLGLLQLVPFFVKDLRTKRLVIWGLLALMLGIQLLF